MSRPWYPRFPGDYVRKTGHLSLMEHGAYSLMLDWYYANSSPLPPSAVEVYRICHAVTDEDKQAVDKVLQQFFEHTEDGYHNSRADQELAARERASDHGRRAATARHGAVPEACQEHAQPMPESCPICAQLSAPVPEAISTSRSKPTTKEQDGVPPCPHAAIIDAYHRHLPMGTMVRIDLWKGHRAQSLLARWREDRKRQDVSWWDGLFAHCSKSKFLTGRATTQPGREPFVVSLDWILKPANFTKILEGHYDR